MDNNNANASNPLSVNNAAATPVTPPPADLPVVAPQTPPEPVASQPAPTDATAGIPQPQAVPAQGAIDGPPHKKGNPMLWVIILLIVSFCCGLFLAAWYFQTQLKDAEQTKVSVIPSKKVIVPTKGIIIGTDGTFQPMEYIDKNNDLIGYDIDLGKRIAGEMGAKAEFKNIPWDDLFKALDNKEIDMIMSSVTITDERKKQYDFSENYLNAGQVIITKIDNTAISSSAALQGKRIAVQEGTTNEKEALTLTSQNLVIRYPDFVQATKALIDGKADAILSDLPAAKGIITANPTLKISSDPFTNEYYGIVFRRGDPNVKKINEILSSLRIKGILTDLKQKWLD